MVELVFGGQLVYTTSCNKHHSSKQIDNFNLLELGLGGSQTGDVLKVVEGNMSDEKLQGANKYHCLTCKTLVKASRGTKLHLPPPDAALQEVQVSAKGTTAWKPS